MIIAGKYEIPEKCPDTCRYHGSLMVLRLQSYCSVCPVLLCLKNGDSARMYRKKWAKLWYKFFKTGKELKFKL